MEGGYIIGIGEVLWDMLPEGRRLGGAPANFAYHVSQFGLKSALVSAVGDDEAGRSAVGLLEEKGLEVFAAVTDYPTGTVRVSLDAAGVPQYDILQGVAWDHIPFSEEMRALAACTRAVCFGSLARRSEVSRRNVRAFVDAVPDGEGQYKVLDINLRQNFYTEEVLLEVMRQANVMKVNDEELALLARMLDCPETLPEGQCRWLAGKFGFRMVVLTCGVRGSYVYAGDTVSFLETPRVEVADTVGAGDSFTAAFVSAIIKGKSVADAHRLAVDVSAYVCSCHGAMPVLPESIVRILSL